MSDRPTWNSYKKGSPEALRWVQANCPPTPPDEAEGLLGVLWALVLAVPSLVAGWGKRILSVLTVLATAVTVLLFWAFLRGHAPAWVLGVSTAVAVVLAILDLLYLPAFNRRP